MGFFRFREVPRSALEDVSNTVVGIVTLELFDILWIVLARDASLDRVDKLDARIENEQLREVRLRCFFFEGLTVLLRGFLAMKAEDPSLSLFGVAFRRDVLLRTIFPPQVLV